jgi:hypothetical protein
MRQIRIPPFLTPKICWYSMGNQLWVHSNRPPRMHDPQNKVVFKVICWKPGVTRYMSCKLVQFIMKRIVSIRFIYSICVQEGWWTQRRDAPVCQENPCQYIEYIGYIYIYIYIEYIYISNLPIYIYISNIHIYIEYIYTYIYQIYIYISNIYIYICLRPSVALKNCNLPPV